MTQSGTLIIARHGMEPHQDHVDLWQQQFNQFLQRIAWHIPQGARQVIVLSSHRPRAAVIAQALSGHLGFEMSLVDELTISRGFNRSQIAAAVEQYRQTHQLVIVISHENICQELAMDVASSVTHNQVASRPDFSDLLSAVVIDPNSIDVLRSGWTYLDPPG